MIELIILYISDERKPTKLILLKLHLRSYFWVTIYYKYHYEYQYFLNYNFTLIFPSLICWTILVMYIYVLLCNLKNAAGCQF